MALFEWNVQRIMRTYSKNGLPFMTPTDFYCFWSTQQVNRSPPIYIIYDDRIKAFITDFTSGFLDQYYTNIDNMFGFAFMSGRIMSDQDSFDLFMGNRANMLGDFATWSEIEKIYHLKDA